MAVKTKVTELPDSRVRLDAEVPSDELQSRIARTAAALGRELRLPGFRKGKVPAAMVIKRMGREAVLDQALRESLPEWYEQAVLQAGVTTVGDPKLELPEPPAAGMPLVFSIEVSVAPKARLGRYKELEAGRREPELPPDAVDREIERLREAFARLESVDRPLRGGDYAVVDFRGTVDGEPLKGGEARDYMLEVGGGRLVEGFDEQLLGARAGESRQVEVDFPGDHSSSEELRGKHVLFEVEVKDVKEKQLPDLDDSFASEASEFDTLSELRADIEERLRSIEERSLAEEFRAAVVDAAVAEAEVELPDELVAARAQEMWARTEEALRRRSLDPDSYLKAAGKTREQVIEEAMPDAARQLGREGVLEAVAEAEGIGVSDDELLELLRGVASQDGHEAERALEELKANGRDGPLRREVRLRKAADFLVGHAKPIEIGRARAREQLWTPEKEARAGQDALRAPGEREPSRPTRLWTPGEGPPQQGSGSRPKRSWGLRRR